MDNMYNITRFSCPQMAQSIIFISNQAFTIRGHGVALGTSSLPTRPFSLPVSKMSPSIPATLRARAEEIARKMKTARTVWRIFISLRWLEMTELCYLGHWVCSTLRLHLKTGTFIASRDMGTGRYNVFVHHIIYLLSVLYYSILGQIVTVLFVMSVLFSGQQVRNFIFSELIIIHISASPDLFYKSTYITSIIYN